MPLIAPQGFRLLASGSLNGLANFTVNQIQNFRQIIVGVTDLRTINTVQCQFLTSHNNSTWINHGSTSLSAGPAATDDLIAIVNLFGDSGLIQAVYNTGLNSISVKNSNGAITDFRIAPASGNFGTCTGFIWAI